jgi:hypothetical protein
MAKSSKKTASMPSPPANYTVNIKLTDNTDPNGPNNFNYAPGLLNVHRGETVSFTCNRPFTVAFVYGSPFVTAGNNPVPMSTFAKDAAATTDPATVAPDADFQPYHYVVTATDAGGKIHIDAGCPTIVVG